MTKVCTSLWLVKRSPITNTKRKVSPLLGLTILSQHVIQDSEEVFFWKHLFSSWPKRLPNLHWNTLEEACLFPLLPQRIYFPADFSPLREEFFAAVPVNNKARFSFASCRNLNLTKTFEAF